MLRDEDEDAQVFGSQHDNNHGSCSGITPKDFHQEKPSLKPFSMEEKISEKDKHGGDPGSKEQVEGDEGWLQLSIGDTTNSRARPIGSSGKLDLFSDGSLFPLRSKSHPALHGLTLRVWNNSCSMTTSSRSVPMAVAMQYEHKGLPGNMMNKVISPPRRPPAGVWFILQAAKNHGRGPSLPQISKSYLRIKDNSVTVRLLLKYLATKLGLGHESEVEITCRGQGLLPCFTLKHVRDNIWCQRDVVTLFSGTPTQDYIMILKYHRRM